jgi:hypothetical protein
MLVQFSISYVIFSHVRECKAILVRLELIRLY